MVEIFKDINYINNFSTIIFNFSKYKITSECEFIIPNSKTNITSCGISSGISGTTRIDKSKKQYIFNLENPYILKDNKVCANYIKAFAELNKKLNNKDNISLHLIVKDFCNILVDFNEDYVYKKLK
jgi:hypothetical protein